MKIPDKLKIMGKTFNVTMQQSLTRDDGQSLLGQVFHAQLTVKINSSLPRQTQDSTLLHEIIEAVCDLNEIEIPHSTICILSENLYQVLKDNKLHFDEED